MAFPLSDEEHQAIESMIQKIPEIVVSAAVRYDGAIIMFERPGRHGNSLSWLHCHGLSVKDFRDHGFLTSRGRYVDRAEAGRIVMETGQGTPRLEPKGINPKAHLFSEDMWNDSPTENADKKPISPDTIF